MSSRKVVQRVLCLMAFAFDNPTWANSTITALGVLPGKTTSTAAGVSNNGQVVVGTSADTTGVNSEAFRWTSAGGMTGLGFLPGGSASVARAISKDGTTIVGDATSSYAKVIGGTEAFRYRDGAMTALHGSPQLIMSQGWAVNADGSVVTDSNSSLFWTAGGGIQQNVILYSGFGVSNDGTVIVGRSSGFVAQRWTAATGAVNLPNTSGGSSVANAVSGDGQVAVGNRNNVACYWSQSAGFVNIGKAGIISSALAVNGDGSIIVGRANTGANGAAEAFVWTAVGGMQSLASILTGQGVDLSAWLYRRVVTLVEATGISDDGRFLVGNGTKQGFLVQLDLTSTNSALDQWRQSQFGSSVNSGNAADGADPDLDGIPNLVEYALASGPNDSSSKPTLATYVVADHMVLGFARVADPALTYHVEAATSMNLRDWTAVWSSTGTANVAGSTIVTDPAAVSGQVSRYLRLRISR